MRNIFKTGLILGLFTLFTFSCKEYEIPTYSGPDAVNLYAKLDYQSGTGYATYDSLEMSFLAYPSSYGEHTFDLLVRIMGAASEKPRTVKLGLGKNNTAIMGTDFTMATEVTIPAGATEIVVPVTAYKHSGLEEEVTVDVIVEKSNDFIGAIKQEVKFKFSAMFPTNWYASSGDLGYTGYLLGTCTKAKYRWYYEVESTIDLVKYATGWSDYATGPALIFKLNSAIDAHNAQFGSDESKWLKDDDGSNLRF